MTAPADLWAVVCADGGLHLWRDAARVVPVVDHNSFGADEIAFADATCDDGPHRVVRYVAAPEPEANGSTTCRLTRKKRGWS